MSMGSAGPAAMGGGALICPCVWTSPVGARIYAPKAECAIVAKAFILVPLPPKWPDTDSEMDLPE